MKKVRNVTTSQVRSSSARSTKILLLTLVALSSGVEGFNSQLPPPWVTPRPNNNSNNNSNSNNGRGGLANASKSNKKVTPSSNTEVATAPHDSENNSKSSSSGSGEEIVEGDISKDGNVSNEVSSHADAAFVAAGSAVTEYYTTSTIPSSGINGHHGTTTASSIADTGNGSKVSDSVRSNSLATRASTRPYLPDLLKMCRPSNLPGVFLLHIVATKVALHSLPSQTALLSTLLRPSHLLVLSALVLTSCSSMVVNDYYDARTGVDNLKQHKLKVPAPVTKRFLTYVYATLLTVLAFLPGKVSRASVVMGSLLTFWYTQHLKPRTWIKNVSCAGLVGLSPLTSAAATCYIHGVPLMNGGPLPSVLRMSAVVFFGIMGREVWMDVLDEEGDRREHIRTVPVVFGKRFASKVVLAFTMLMSAMAVGTPLWDLIMKGSSAPILKRVIMSALGSGMVLTRAIQIVKAQGLDTDLLTKGVEEGKLALFFILASFT